MDSILEQQRRMHEERERLVNSMVRECLHDKKSHKEKINSDHRMKLLLDRYITSTGSLAEHYEDAEASRKAEVEAVGGPNEFAEFYSRLKALKEYHRRNPEEIAVPLSMEFQEVNEAIDDPDRIESDMIEFSDEEGYGRFLDLHLLFEKYTNLKGIKRTDYVTYVTAFDQLYDIPKDTKKTTDYRRYLESLSKYLVDFIKRTRPLLDLTEELSKVNERFVEQWAAGSFPGWPKEHSAALSNQGVFLDLSPYNSWEELKVLGLERLKSALIAQKLKCGGTLEERARRLFASKGKRAGELDAALRATTLDGQQTEQKQVQPRRELAGLEAQLYFMIEMLSEERAATKENVERKQARTAGEIMEEEEEESAAAAAAATLSDDEDASDVPYNPKNLPLGWDGKPIPYWLYKLHGLNINYPCEICGNQIYKGPKAFQRHFSEWRHSHGMRCLGIPNTAHFANVTKISDAIDLWGTIRDLKEAQRFRPDVDEEYEDSQGNVVNRKTYEDLKRQGLL